MADPPNPKCQACDERGPRSKCDKARPACSWCARRDLVCVYPAPLIDDLGRGAENEENRNQAGNGDANRIVNPQQAGAAAGGGGPGAENPAPQAAQPPQALPIDPALVAATEGVPGAPHPIHAGVETRTAPETRITAGTIGVRIVEAGACPHVADTTTTDTTTTTTNDEVETVTEARADVPAPALARDQDLGPAAAHRHGDIGAEIETNTGMRTTIANTPPFQANTPPFRPTPCLSGQHPALRANITASGPSPCHLRPTSRHLAPPSWAFTILRAPSSIIYILESSLHRRLTTASLQMQGARPPLPVTSFETASLVGHWARMYHHAMLDSPSTFNITHHSLLHSHVISPNLYIYTSMSHNMFPLDEYRRNNPRRVLHRPDLATNAILDGAVPVIPPVMRDIMRRGWDKHIPLPFFDPEFLKRKDAAHYAKIAIGVSSSTKAAEKLAELNATNTRVKNEEDMDQIEWQYAWDNLMGLIEEYFPPATVKSWARHWGMIWAHRDRRRKWHRLMKYCMRVREAATQQNFVPGVWQEKIWEEIVEDDRDDAYERRRSQATFRQYTHTTPKASSSSYAIAKKRPQAREVNPRERETIAQTAARPPSSRTARPCLSGDQATPGLLMAPNSATPSTPSRDAHSTHALVNPISAASAVHLSTPRSHAHFDPRRVSTSLIPEIWETELRALGLWDKFHDVPTGLREGFRIGTNFPIPHTHTPENHKSALLQPSIIEQHIQSELAAGRYVGPFTRDGLEQLIGPFRSAPLGVVEKSSAPGSFRIIQDFSFSPDNFEPGSLNSQIDASNFPCVWGFFDDVARVIATAPPGTLAATLDVDAAYRQIPIHPNDQAHIVFRWGDDYYVDGRVPFGACSSNGLFARCGDSIAELYSRRGFGIILKWVDDFLFIQFPSTLDTPPNNPPRFSIEAIYEYAKLLGWPWKLSKTHPFAPIFKYLGFLWDISLRLVRLPDTKREKYLARVRAWLAKGTVTLRDTEVLVGSLIHCTLVIPEGRPHLSGAIRFMSAFPHTRTLRFMGRPPSAAARSDIEWWSHILSTPHNGMAVHPPPPLAPISIFTDASTSGLGMVVDKEYTALKLVANWKSIGRDIGWAEAIAVELVIHWLVNKGLKDASLVINCDNQGVVFAWQAGRSRNPHQNASIAAAMILAATHNLHIRLVYVRSKENPADGPSRGTPLLDHTWTQSPFTIPTHLSKSISFTNVPFFYRTHTPMIVTPPVHVNY
ncbi:hypothetical protein RhiJN_20150 [Ceratobasidium sp. AG-Ba]|nr:hypothetical protein RhiJN_20150 [Ceratobasidium sp. AG-Ba]